MPYVEFCSATLNAFLYSEHVKCMLASFQELEGLLVIAQSSKRKKETYATIISYKYICIYDFRPQRRNTICRTKLPSFLRIFQKEKKIGTVRFLKPDNFH